MKRFNSIVITTYIFLPILAGLVLFSQAPAIANTQKIAILPFEIHSQRDLAYIGEGVYQMLTTRLSWKEHVLVVESNELKAAPNKAMATVAAALDTDYVISGSITEFDGAFSLDTTVFKTRENAIETFFGQAETLEEIIPKLDLMAAKINHKIFNRKTASLAPLDPAPSEKEALDIRANPEKLMPQIVDSEQAGDRPFWKIWGTDGPSTGEEEDRPFWKFWEKDAPDDEFDGVDPMETETMEEDGVNQGMGYGEEPEKEKEDKPFWKFW